MHVINYYRCGLSSTHLPFYLSGRSRFASESEDVVYANNYARIIAFVAVSPKFSDYFSSLVSQSLVAHVSWRLARFLRA